MKGLKNRKHLTIIPILLLVLISLYLCAALSAYAENDKASVDKYAQPPKIKAKSAILIDAKTGDVLFEKKADVRRAPASTTKILTALLAIENFAPDDVVKVDKDACGVEGSSVGLVPGEEIKASDLLYATLLESGNDAATALAIGMDGSVSKFSNRMNGKVAELGLTNSHFVNPHGLDAEEHYTTARELAAIACAAMKNDDFRKYVSTYQYKMPRTNKQPKRLLHNSNRMLYDKSKHVKVYGKETSVVYPGVTGIKTGFTDAAGNCLVSGVSRDGFDLISVVLASKGMDEYSDTIGLLEYGLHNFEEVTYQKKGDVVFTRPVINSVQESMNLVLADDVVATVRKDEKEAYSIDGEVTEKTTEGGLLAPITAGEKVGTAWLKNANNGSTVAKVDIVAENSMEPREEEQDALGVISDIIDDGVEPISVLFWVIGIAVFIAVVIVVIAVVRAAVNSRKRRKNRMYGVKLKDSVDPREIRRIKSINHKGWGGK